ncbi:MAG: hypothetical protein LWX51_17645 [Deltaproteobacteria bacterium]|nr:hypothetical protein [Deltaproteobacteria bacterium]
MRCTFIGTGYSLGQCGQIITSDTTLECDLDCDGTAITIGAVGITLDLNGCTLNGHGTGYGVDNDDGWDNVTIKDGIIDGFRVGISLDHADNNIIEELEVRNSTDKG